MVKVMFWKFLQPPYKFITSWKCQASMLGMLSRTLCNVYQGLHAMLSYIFRIFILKENYY